MKTHANEPTEIALLNHVSSYVGSTCYVVHRLDKETSGAILFAKNPLSCPFSTVFWKIKHPTRVLGLDPRQLSTKPSSTRIKSDAIAMIGASAWSIHARAVLRNSGDATEKIGRNSLVKCQLKTGRTHQIRVHLSHHGHPIVGDPLYNPARGERLMLHAHRLTFTNPLTLETIQVEAPSKSFEEGLKK